MSALKHASTKGQGLILVNSGTMRIFSDTETISNRDNIILELITEWYWQSAESYCLHKVSVPFCYQYSTIVRVIIF